MDFPPPPDGPIQLGNVITDLKRPEVTLTKTEPEKTFSTTKKTVEFSKEKLRKGHFSILTKFLSFLGFGIDVGAEWDKTYRPWLCRVVLR